MVVAAGYFMTKHGIQSVVQAEHLIIAVRYGIGVSPVFVYELGQQRLGHSRIAVFTVARSFYSPYLVGIVVFPSISEFTSEFDAFYGFPVHSGIVVLLEAADVLVGCIQYFERSVACVIHVFIIVTATIVQFFDRGKYYGPRIYGGGCIRLVVIGSTTDSCHPLIGQTGIEVKCQPFVYFSIYFGIDIIFGKSGVKHNAFFVIA